MQPTRALPPNWKSELPDSRIVPERPEIGLREDGCHLLEDQLGTARRTDPLVHQRDPR